MITKKEIKLLVLLMSSLILITSCSVFMAAKQPGKKDLSVLRKGTERSRVIAELGMPQFVDNRDGRKIDIFNFVQGYSTGSKTGRALFHGIADVFTLGLWEVVGTPIEGIASGTEVKVEVTYDNDDRVELVKAFSGGEKVRDATEPEEDKEPATESAQKPIS